MSQLQNNFDMLYKEWKSYKDFFFAEMEKHTESVKERVAELSSDLKDTDKILEYFYDTRVYPKMYEADFNLLSLKLVTAYKLTLDSVEVSEEAKKEIDELISNHRSTQRFVIEGGKAVPINEELIKATKDQFRKAVNDKDLLKGIQDLVNE